MIDFAASEKAVNSFARRVMRRATAGHIQGVKLEDIQQECWCAWCKARDSFDETKGVPFLAYLRNGMRLHIGGWLSGYETQTHLAPFSLNQKVGEEEENELGDVLEVEAEEEQVDFWHQELALALLSERARQFVTLLMNPPLELFQQLDRMAERAKFGRERGHDTLSPRRITGNVVMDLMGADRSERHAIYSELRRLPGEINQC